MRQIWARIILVAGLCVCAYPFVSQLVNDVVVYHQTQRAADKDAAKYAARLQRQDAATPEDSFDAKNLSKDVRAHLLAVLPSRGSACGYRCSTTLVRKRCT
ncbi:hypothetical protein [Lacticaseibacillus thailandensis]|uniref:hypothetical protein n=1 Tax=Lacticaseibacillus thailandensis TaxID=381741 RepID=UPI000A726FDF|nr:hypothetical protein [Lacticaseibacillus thailandensis]